MKSDYPIPSLVPRTINRLTAPKSSPAALLRAHRWLYLRSDGRIGPGMIGAPTLLLHSTGRRSGQRRTSALVFARDDGRFVLAASNDGLDRPPAWFHNVCANPTVDLQVGRHHLSGSAAVVERPDPDHPRLWDLMNATNNGRYDAYQSKTARPIALVVVSPLPPPGAP